MKAHATSTGDAAKVLTIAYDVYAYLFREEHLAGLGLPQITAEHLKMLREAAVFMALNKVELDGHISNVGPCWFFPAATSVVFDLDTDMGEMLDEVYHGGWCTAASPSPASPAASSPPTAPPWPRSTRN
ncbi:hypothetical protein GCM10010442_18710 [Kitasatospora kifunensis]|uniref:Uncharacterized protein n=1 Tax=Kitasatospora kifunensis TaxID=58351 RepID=A0A7W7R6B6_KITKI|nr:hypothetical protein [Kitasatospora kifunensis]